MKRLSYSSFKEVLSYRAEEGLVIPDKSNLDIKIETINLPKGELPEEVIFDNLTIAVSVSPKTKIRIKSDGRPKEVNVYPNHLGIFPNHLPMWSCWNREINHFYFRLSNELIQHHSKEIFDTDKFEIIPIFDSFQDGLIYQLCSSIKTELTSSSDVCCIYIQTMLDALAVHLLKQYSSKNKPLVLHSGGLSMQTQKKVKDYIEDNLESSIKLNDLVQLSNLSRYHFTREFKVSVGCSPHQYIISRRIERAKLMLSTTNMTIAHISIACGFNHQSHLNRHFKRLTSTTPKAFRSITAL